jgi:H+/Cl- antiporter ClcA
MQKEANQSPKQLNMSDEYRPHLYTDAKLLIERLQAYTNDGERLKIVKDLQETNEQILAHEFNLAYQRSMVSILAHTVLLTVYFAVLSMQVTMINPSGSSGAQQVIATISKQTVEYRVSELAALSEWIPCFGAAVAIFSLSGFWAAHRVVDVLEYQRSVFVSVLNHFLRGKGLELNLKTADWEIIDLGSHRRHPNSDKASSLWVSKQFGFWSPVGLLLVFLIIWLAIYIATFSGGWKIPMVVGGVLAAAAVFANWKWWFFKTKFLLGQLQEAKDSKQKGFLKNLLEWIKYH